MVLRAHVTEFAGHPVAQFWPDQSLPDVDGPVAWRVAHWDFDDDGGAVEGLNPSSATRSTTSSTGSTPRRSGRW